MTRATKAEMPCKVGGETLNLHPLSIEEIERIDNWMRAKFLRSVKEAADGDEDVLRVGMEEMMKISFFNRRGIRFLANLEGISYVMALSAGITHERAIELTRVDYDFDDFNTTFHILNGTGKPQGSDPPKTT